MSIYHKNGARCVFPFPPQRSETIRSNIRASTRHGFTFTMITVHVLANNDVWRCLESPRNRYIFFHAMNGNCENDWRFLFFKHLVDRHPVFSRGTSMLFSSYLAQWHKWHVFFARKNSRPISNSLIRYPPTRWMVYIVNRMLMQWHKPQSAPTD